MLPVPVLLKVRLFVALLPAATLPKARLVGLTETLPVLPANPLDGVRNATICMIQGPEELSGAVAL